MNTERQQGTPVLVNKDDGSLRQAKRVFLGRKHLNEGWIQDLIHRQPGILPVGELEPAFEPLVAIGREVPTKVGNIDNLFINPDGYLTIVETKLWRNPEARRQVVGQIIDYAKEITRWTYGELDSRVRQFNQAYHSRSTGLLETVQNSGLPETSVDELRFPDLVTRSLRHGRFLLLVVGDGIRESVEDMAAFLNQTPNLLFTLGLVELQVYDLTQKEYLVIPQIVMRTREVTRAVVKVEGVAVDKVSIEVENEQPETKQRRSSLSETEFYQLLKNARTKKEVEVVRQLFSDVESLGCFIQWRRTSAMIRYKDPQGSGQHLTILGVKTDGWIFAGWLPDQLDRINVEPEIGRNYLRAVASLFENCEVGQRNDLSRPVWLDELIPVRERLVELIEELILGINEQTEIGGAQ